MTINDQIRDKKIQYNINWEAANIEDLTHKEILTSNQKQAITQAKFTYSPLGIAFEKQIKTIEDQGKKQKEQFKIKDNLKQLKNMLMMVKIVH